MAEPTPEQLTAWLIAEQQAAREQVEQAFTRNHNPISLGEYLDRRDALDDWADEATGAKDNRGRHNVEYIP